MSRVQLNRRLHLEPVELAHAIVDLLSDRQAEDITLLDISKVAGFTDFFVIASATNVRQMRALMDVLDEALGKKGIHPLRREGSIESGWVLLDYGQVIVHIFTPEERAYYNLEALWGRGVPVVRFQT